MKMSNLLSVSSVMTNIGFIILAIVVLLFMVLIHELGHYTAGKMLKFKINEFSVGFGPKILQKKKKNGEIFSLRAIPLGGYCAFDGEDADADGKQNPTAFNNQKPWKRLIVLFFGAFFNFLSAIIFSFVLLFANGYDLVQVKSVDNTSINYSFLQAGDVLTGVDGHKIDFVHDDSLSVLIKDYTIKTYPKIDADGEFVQVTINGKAYNQQLKDITFDIKRAGKKQSVDAKVYALYAAQDFTTNGNTTKAGEYVGWSLVDTSNEGELTLDTYRYSFGEAILNSVPFSFKWAYKMLIIIGRLFTGRLDITALGGPVTTVKMIANYSRASINYLLVLLPLIAVNLAVFNLLPIPALDGCQMLFVLIEWIRKKPINQKVINAINNVGLIVLFGFVIIVDIIQFII